MRRSLKNLLARHAALLLVLVGIGFTTKVAAQNNPSQEWEKTLAAARKEGQVNVYIYRYERLLEDFKKDFAGINVVAVTGRGNELTNRIMAERRAGKFIADVYSGGTNSLYNTLYKGKALDPLKPVLMLPEVIDTSKWYGNEHRYADPEGKYIFSYIASPSNAQLAFNTNMVNPKEFKSYWDVTQAKMEGQNGFFGPARYRPRRNHAVFLLQSRARSRVPEKILRRHGYDLREKFQADDRLAGAGKVRDLHGLQRLHEGQRTRTAG